ncbi:EamA-like transporter family [gamma proteobacterium HIMB55]|nr:EamA-like transporter family [gamma proteobacterium HIMB55]
MPQRDSSTNSLALAFGLGAVGLWSTMATAFKCALEFSSPMQLIALAATVSWIFFAARLMYLGRLSQLKQISSATMTRCLALGFLNPALFYWVLFTAYDLLPAQDAMAINYTWGLTLPFIAACFSRSLPSFVEVSLALLSYVGILIIVTDGNLAGFEFENITGVMLAIGSTVLWGLSWVINTRTVERDQVDPELALLINFSMAVPVLWMILSATGSLPHLNVGTVLGGIYVGLFEMGVAFVLWMKAMQLTDTPIRVSSLIFLAPPLSLVFIATVLGEPVAASTLTGLVFILAGLAGQQAVSNRKDASSDNT